MKLDEQKTEKQKKETETIQYKMAQVMLLILKVSSMGDRSPVYRLKMKKA